jgi:hypothetical protein
MTARFSSDMRWSAAINGKPWEDQSFAPTKDQTFKVNITLEGGGKKTNKAAVWMKLGNKKKEQVFLIWNTKECWDDFRRKVSGELEHDAWTAIIKSPDGPKEGKPWFDNSTKPGRSPITTDIISGHSGCIGRKNLRRVQRTGGKVKHKTMAQFILVLKGIECFIFVNCAIVLCKTVLGPFTFM